MGQCDIFHVGIILFNDETGISSLLIISNTYHYFVVRVFRILSWSSFEMCIPSTAYL